MRAILCVSILLLSHIVFSQVGYKETGKASYYGDAFHGRKTASGEKYNMYDFTAAHKKLTFGSMVKVTNLDNGKEIMVRINDRGPYKDGRIIDLSKAAGAKIGILNAGVANVSIEVISIEEKSSVQKTEEQPTKVTADGLYSLSGEKKIVEGYGLQIGSFSSLENAKKIGEKMQDLEFNDVFIQLVTNPKKTYRVLVGVYKSAEEAKKDIKKLRENGVEAFAKIYEK